MKALTLWQPWASLVSLGVKTVETRSWATNYRGRLVIHAAKTTKGIDLLPGDCEGTVEGDWRYGYIGDFQASYCRRSGPEGRCGETQLVSPPEFESDVDIDTVMPLGAVVATATLVDVLPMVDRIPSQSSWKEPWSVMTVEPWPIIQSWHGFGSAEGRACSGRLPYGDFAPGRFAWLLDDTEPLSEPIPARGRQGLWEWAA